MCLTIKPSTPLLTANKDIAVYKVISTKNRSIYERFLYEPNKLYRLRKALVLKKYTNGFDAVHDGFHSFASETGAIDEYKCFHDSKIVKFTIPKGAKYYKGEYGGHISYTSTSIRSGNLKPILTRK